MNKAAHPPFDPGPDGWPLQTCLERMVAPSNSFGSVTELFCFVGGRRPRLPLDNRIVGKLLCGSDSTSLSFP